MLAVWSQVLNRADSSLPFPAPRGMQGIHMQKMLMQRPAPPRGMQRCPAARGRMVEVACRKPLHRLSQLHLHVSRTIHPQLFRKKQLRLWDYFFFPPTRRVSSGGSLQEWSCTTTRERNYQKPFWARTSLLWHCHNQWWPQFLLKIQHLSSEGQLTGSCRSQSAACRNP